MRRTVTHDLHPLRYLDLIVLAVAAPPLLLSGTSAIGYGVGAATWLLIRALGRAVESSRDAIGLNQQAALWLAYRLARILLLAAATIAVREAVDKNAGITVLAVIASAFTIQLLGSLLERYARAQRSAGAQS